MSYGIPIPDGLTLPKDGATKSFELPVVFIIRDEKLLPLSVGGVVTGCEKKEPKPETVEMEIPAEGGFMVAVEKGMAGPRGPMSA